MLSHNHSNHHHHHHHFSENLFHGLHRKPDHPSSMLSNTGDLHNSSGVLFVHASDFVHHVTKDEISQPIAAHPMGQIDVTANDHVLRGLPSRRELKSLERHAEETAAAIGSRSKDVFSLDRLN